MFKLLFYLATFIACIKLTALDSKASPQYLEEINLSNAKYLWLYTALF